MEEDYKERRPRAPYVSSLYSNHGLNISLVHKGPRHKQGYMTGDLAPSSVVDVIEQATRKYEEQMLAKCSSRRPAVLAATRNTSYLPKNSFNGTNYVPSRSSNRPAGSHLSASTTPSGPFSSQDLIGSYSTVTADPLRTDELRIGGGGNTGSLTDREVVRWKSSNQQPLRPPSQGKEHHRLSKGSVEKDSTGGEKRGQSPLMLNNGKLLNTSTNTNNNTATVGSINNQFKALGMRNNFLGGQQIPTSSSSGGSVPPQSQGRLQPNPPPHNRSDELIAMGTNWNPPPSSNNNSSGHNMRNGRPSQAATSSSSNVLMPVASRKSVSTRGPMLAPATSKHSKHDDVPRYSDPLPGAPPSFQQRLAELSSLEQETIRYEKSRKFKKKVKDSS